LDKTLKYNVNVPFRLGCTSYIIPDNIVPNVEAAAPYFDDVELLCFEAPDRSYYIDEITIARLKELAQLHVLSYTVHCPIDNKAGAEEPEERGRFVDAFLRIFRLTAPLQPAGYILHLEGLHRHDSHSAIRLWQERTSEVCSRIVEGLSKEKRALICLENLDYPLELIESTAERFGFSFCVDLGHLWRYGQDWESYLDHALARTKIIHLHGVRNGNDHISIAEHEGNHISSLFNNKLRSYSGVLTLELFSKREVLESVKVMEGLWAV
jgi:sugar phosphate isomerase/epimerase